MSVATQDLLPREEEASVDLFNMPTDRASVISDRYSQMETQRETTQPEFSHDITRELEGLNSDHFQSSISEELIGAEKEQEKSVQEDNVLPFKDDFGEDTNFGYAGIEDDILDAGGAVDMERDQSSIDMDHIPSTRITRRILSNNNFARKRIFEARSEKIKAKDDVFNRHHVKQIFTNKIAMSKNVPCHVGTFSMVADIFCDQLADDILAYKKNGEENEENEENEEENSDEITLEDIVLLMKRQRVLNDKTSLQSLIYKHLPREYWDDLITSALADNVLSEERSGLTD
ncbi:hypothetical protein CU098_003155 [Rhizopus stolonifer]|uniref:CENP-T/Histone H4 histone fold domain-containing protein n=1 Tax=Rhizopus stolonifer TaxID=4846 RepID=A0A367INT2_RHIST|nr:hypothetical protein CU098_003155 [Rhizopus stolonifer]